MRRLPLLGLLPFALWCADLQPAVDRAMLGKPGAAIIADVPTGQLLAGYRVERARTRAPRVRL